MGSRFFPDTVYVLLCVITEKKKILINSIKFRGILHQRDETDHEVDVKEEADVKHEVYGAGDNETPHVDCASGVQAVHDEHRYNSVPHADSAQYRH